MLPAPAPQFAPAAAPTAFARISFSESGVEGIVRDYATPAELDHALARIASKAPEGGAYDKTYISIGLPGGKTYETRLDVQRKGATIEDHIRGDVRLFDRSDLVSLWVSEAHRLDAQILARTALQAVLAAKAVV